MDLKDLLHRYYYQAQCSAGSHLRPSELAEQLVLAHSALCSNVQAPQDKSVFFGDADHGQKIMQVAFMAGAMALLLEHGPPASWDTVLQNLNFHQTQWDFSWVRSLHGKAQSRSKKLAVGVFCQMFKTGALPKQASTVADFLRGDRAQIDLVCSELTSSNRPSRSGQKTERLDRGSVKTINIGRRRHVKIAKVTQNIAHIEVTDKQSPPGRLVSYERELARRGMILESSRHGNPLSLLVTMFHYGDVQSTVEVDLGW